ncbi:bifunctional DNA primase/polymerase [Rhizobium sp. BK068]|uniref:bifunctional DNA primase/polymerase n=1 Tax=Rhizobium sp. BK068 TaxID=2512130 RepID=UPI001044E8C3|nr:bifunctional DNA primase/polymerase [Rhizobium sp. BK068]TCM62267.1 bifunctional DNA primase/polymerase-like protein [Rhizobium sp. BK068]
MLQIALDYISRGWTPVPVLPRGKRPTVAKWQTAVIDRGNAAHYFDRPDLNIGVILGNRSSGLVDIDLDRPEARACAPYFLPPTGALFGRPSSTDSHWLYISDLATDPQITVASVRFTDPEEVDPKQATLLEVRIGGCAGAQTVVPPSIHESGEAIRWSNGGLHEPARVQGQELLRTARRLSAASLLAKHWPQGSGMHNAAILIGGCLARAGFTTPEVGVFIEAVARAAGDPDVKDRKRTAQDAAEAFVNGGKAKGFPTLEKVFGRKIADRLSNWLDLKVDQEARMSAGGGIDRTTIRLSTSIAKTAEATEAALVAAGLEIYARDTLLVRPYVVEDGKTRTGRFLPVTTAYLRMAMDEAADFERFDARAKDYVAAKPPKEVAEVILDRAGRWLFPPVRGIIMTPSLRPDGSLLAVRGYDPQTKLYLLDPPPMPTIPDTPSLEEAKAALGLLADILREFPLVGPEDFSVGLSALISPVLRPALGRVPLHAITAPDIGSGKSYLAHCCSVLATGHHASIITTGKDEAEMEKRLGTALIDGLPIVLIDNVSSILKGDFLCAAVDQPRLSIRLLGHSKSVQVEPHAVMFVTGNNLRISGDVIRRTITCQLNPGVENAYERIFESSPLTMIAADRGKYIAAALVACRGFLLSGLKPVKPPLAGFEEWSNVVRSTIVGLGFADPVRTINALRENDPERERFGQVIDAWQAAFEAREVTASGVVALANEKDSSGHVVRTDLHDALMAVAKERNGSVLSTQRLGEWLRSHQNRILDGRVFRRGDKTQSGVLWRLEDA